MQAFNLVTIVEMFSDFLICFYYFLTDVASVYVDSVMVNDVESKITEKSSSSNRVYYVYLHESISSFPPSDG